MPPTFRVPLDRLCWPLHDLDWAHIFPAEGEPVSRGPILVARLNNGLWLVEDGRHRVIRAHLRGEKEIDAIPKE